MQNNDLNFRTDIILLPTGDGAAVCFTFEGLHNIHVRFAESFLKNESEQNLLSSTCEKFEVNGWCNCHNKFNVRIGIDEGKAIIYKDINDNYNIAGNPINMAARLLGEANRNQILLTENAYKQVVDLDENPNYSDEFIEIIDVDIKHDLKLNIYVLKSDKEYINNEIAEKHIKNAKIEKLRDKVRRMTDYTIDFDSPEAGEEIFGRFKEVTSILGDFFQTALDGKIQSELIDDNGAVTPLTKKTRRSKK